MSRIPQEDLTTLQTAVAVKTVAEGAVAELEEMSVAHLINEAANCGQMTATYGRAISQALQTKLISKGYVLFSPSPIARNGDEVIISWENAE